MDQILSFLSDDKITALAGESLNSDVLKMTIAFLIAARLHRKWVKQDMAEQFGLLRSAIDHVTEVMSRRIDGLDNRINKLEDKT